METHATESLNTIDLNSTVDVSRPFRSVKEAVAIFGDRLLTREPPTPSRFSLDKGASGSSMFLQSPSKTVTTEIYSSPVEMHSSHELARPVLDKESSKSLEHTQSPDNDKSSSTLGKQLVESFVNEPTLSPKSLDKSPSKVWKELVEPCVNEPTLSSQVSENENQGNVVHRNDLVMMLMVLRKLESELQETKMELKLLKERESETEVALASLNAELHKNMSKIAKAEATEAAIAATKSMVSIEGGKREMVTTNEEKARGDSMVKNMDSPTLAQILSISDYEGYFRGSKANNKLMKKKPIIPLVTEFIPWKKRPPQTNKFSGPLFSPNMYFG